MGYDVEEMVAMFRRDMDDKTEPYLWEEEELLELFEEAQDDFTEEVDLLTEELALTFVANTPLVDYPRYVTRIRAMSAPSGKDVNIVTSDEFLQGSLTDDYGLQVRSVNSQWRTATGSEPKAVITDIETNKLRAYPIPTADGTLTTSVYRKAKTSIIDGYEFEVTDRNMQRAILLKVRSLAYGKHDSETYNPQLEEEFEIKYINKRDELARRERRRTRKMRPIQYGGIS